MDGGLRRPCRYLLIVVQLDALDRRNDLLGIERCVRGDEQRLDPLPIAREERVFELYAPCLRDVLLELAYRPRRPGSELNAEDPESPSVSRFLALGAPDVYTMQPHTPARRHVAAPFGSDRPILSNGPGGSPRGATSQRRPTGSPVRWGGYGHSPLASVVPSVPGRAAPHSRVNS